MTIHLHPTTQVRDAKCGRCHRITRKGDRVYRGRSRMAVCENCAEKMTAPFSRVSAATRKIVPPKP